MWRFSLLIVRDSELEKEHLEVSQTGSSHLTVQRGQTYLVVDGLPFGGEAKSKQKEERANFIPVPQCTNTF